MEICDMIKRHLFEKLKKWMIDKDRKPLILKGLRQVGKTSLLKKFGEECFESTAYFNFETDKNLADFFNGSISPDRIIQGLSILSGISIQPGRTLVIFDEIQECNNALNSLKYFCENKRELHLVAAGSLLGIALSKPASFPVGKVDFMTLYPLSVSEIIMSAGNDLLFDNLKKIELHEPIPEPIFDQYNDFLKTYFITGGMPEAVAKWIESKDLEKTEQIIKNILQAYEYDFSKHAPAKDIPKIREIWESVPNQLGRENKKFVYTALKPGARAREYKDAINWLKDAGLVYKISRISKPNFPISSYVDPSSFKIYMADVGLLRVKSRLPASVFLESSRLFTEFKGAMSENFVLNELISSSGEQPFYWTSDAAAEIEFIIQSDTKIVPVEVKSGTNVQSKSLKVYRNRYKPEVEIRISQKNVGKENNMISLPLFMSSEIHRLLKNV